MGVSALWTIGYEKASLSEVIAALKDARIDIVLDVRELPNSRRAGFSKNMLAASLEEAGIAYRHIKALGTPKAGRDAAKAGDIATMRAIMNVKLDGEEAQAALADAADTAREKRACLLCLEHNWRACHRALVAERLQAFGFRATHLAPEPAG
jgi:uncharacterized protein (DUF488 family)